MKNLRICLAFAILTVGFAASASPSILLGCPDYTEEQAAVFTASDLEGLAQACQDAAYSLSMNSHLDSDGLTYAHVTADSQIYTLRAAILRAYARKKSSASN